MRFGGPVFPKDNDPENFVLAHVKKGYRAALCPAGLKAGMSDEIRQYREAFKKHGVVPAEVGVWNNPLSRDRETAKNAFDYAVSRLTLADELEAGCCVNVVGTWYEDNWYGPCPENFTEDFFAYAVEVSRKIIDAVKPVRTKMTFELMPFVFLDSPSEYMRFLGALDRPSAGVHFDPANCVNSLRLLYGNAAFFEESFRIFGNKIVSMHLKDIRPRTDPVSVMFDEVPIGEGKLDYIKLLQLIDATQPEDTPVLLEHLADEAMYDRAAASLRNLAVKAGVSIN
ncbi:MAG: sugar phosphate isomerase/epimerase [Treponema sp.]|jgi:sugar phosphate isomerase/epimerase|nr:sugar phosphate isomerase/epimerase [Treponema sp.]